MPIRIDRKVLSITISIALLTASLAAQQKNQLAQVRVEQGWLSGMLDFSDKILNSFEEGINVRALTSHQGKSFGIQK